MNISNIKNNFSIWGKRGETPIHLRYAIDNKPTEYTYTEDDDTSVTVNTDNYDWREVLYRMALVETKKANPQTTGYE